MDMEALFGELGRTIADKGKAAASKARDLTEAVQVKAQINAERRKLQEAFAALGHLYYKEHWEEEGHPQQGVFEAIREGEQRIRDLEEKLKDLEDVTICPECGCRAAKEAVYCSRCGRKLHPDQEEDSQKEAEGIPALTVLEDEKTQ